MCLTLSITLSVPGIVFVVTSAFTAIIQYPDDTITPGSYPVLSVIVRVCVRVCTRGVYVYNGDTVQVDIPPVTLLVTLYTDSPTIPDTHTEYTSHI